MATEIRHHRLQLLNVERLLHHFLHDAAIGPSGPPGAAKTGGGDAKKFISNGDAGFGTQAEVAFRTSNLNLMIFGTRSSRAARAMARSRTTTTINNHRDSTPIATVAKNGEHIRLI